MKKNNAGLGKALRNKLEKNLNHIAKNKDPIFIQQSQINQEQQKKNKMQSVIEPPSLDDFLRVAEMSQTSFQANRNLKFKEVREQINHKKIVVSTKPSKQLLKQENADQKLLEHLQLPRRPNWKDAKSKKDLQNKENQAYLNWRRKLAAVEESHPNVEITPYEKNIQIWRQLWRVVERADFLVQIVDGRDPLFFICEDLFQYFSELNPGKQSLLLINKSDLVKENIRTQWSQYFREKNINHIFFTSKGQFKQEGQKQQAEETVYSSQIEQSGLVIGKYLNIPQIASTQQLVRLLTAFSCQSKSPSIEVGLVGYPNVGKSSVINALLKKKKVGVASMPGKTKHFQTLLLNQKVTLCDCPGLVFPKVSSSRSEMVLAGLYPIDALKQYEQPMFLLTHRIPKVDFEKKYTLHWKQGEAYNYETICDKYSSLKGFFAGNGMPNRSLAARAMIKDYVNGYIVYCKRPPGLQPVQILENKYENILELQKQESCMKGKQAELQRDVDNQFFGQQAMEEISTQQLVKVMEKEDLLNLIEGRKVGGFRLSKEERKNVKHALKRGEDLETIKQKYILCSGKDPNLVTY